MISIVELTLAEDWVEAKEAGLVEVMVAGLEADY